MATSKQPTDTFVLVPGVHIEVNSKSGNTYYITLDSDGNAICTCKGFSYYQRCRHITEAQHIEFARPKPVALPDYSAIREHNLDIISGKAPPMSIHRTKGTRS